LEGKSLPEPALGVTTVDKIPQTNCENRLIVSVVFTASQSHRAVESGFRWLARAKVVMAEGQGIKQLTLR